jgi:alpha-tubulin suppressor-like RCC1 family protein
MRAVALVAVLSIAAACKYKVARYCDEQTPCDDPAFPFCDFDGALEGVERQCVANPVDGGGGDAREEGFRVVQMAAGRDHTCAVLSDGELRCFGDNTYGMLGVASMVAYGDNEPASDAPFAIVDGPVQAADLGLDHSCAVFRDGNVQCWGMGAHGELGQGDFEQLGDDEAPRSRPPIDVGSPTAEVCAGSSFSCARLKSGDVHCFGLGVEGNLGIPGVIEIGGTTKPSQFPPIELGGIAIDLDCGSSAYACAVLEDGSVRCWGSSFEGALGIPGVTQIGRDESPSSVGPVQVGLPVEQIATGNKHTCALLDNGRIRCWGTGAALGYGNADVIGDDEHPSVAPFVDVDGLVVEIVAGGGQTCARLENGDVRCWGFPNGQSPDPIGDDETPSSVPPLPLPAPAVGLAAGTEHACAVLETDDVYCWGVGAMGRLGYGDEDDVGIGTSVTSKGPVPIIGEGN